MKNTASRITVALDHDPYEIVIGGGGLIDLGQELIKAGVTKGIKVLLVSNADVAGPYGETALKSLRQSGFHPSLFIVEAGEDQKTIANIERIHDAAYQAQLERGSLIVALGGGVVGDMAGFAAATWLRGIAFAQVPTTLLAMVDASIGGKTGVNHVGGKNLIGAFHQPKIVLIDPFTLQSLPDREFRAGMAEVIKYGVITDTEIFKILEKAKCINNYSDIDKQLLSELLERSAAAKANVVAKDEQEQGLRAILNYGHTFGHVIEKLCGYGNWLHGEAVAMGMVAIGELGLITNSWNEYDSDRQKRLIEKAGLPIRWPKLNINDVLKALQGDKKVRLGKVRFIIPHRIGEVKISDDIDEDQIINCLSRLK